MHAIWWLLLDDEFMDAYENGIVTLFPDGIYCHVFPFFLFTQPIILRSMYITHKDTVIRSNIFDRVLLASIRYLGTHLCPCCLVKKCDICEFGSKADLKCCEKLVWIDDGS